MLNTVIVTLMALASLVLAQEQRFTEQPKNVSVVVGSTAILRCIVENPIGTIQWTRNGFGLGADRDLPGFPRYAIIGSADLGEHNLMVSNVQLDDDGIYQCQVGATETVPGIRSNNAHINVLVPPDDPIIEGAPKVEVVAGKAVNLTCHADNGKPAANITWALDGAKVHQNIHYSSETKEDGKRKLAISEWEFNPRKIDQGKRIECHVENPAVYTPLWTRATLEVLYVPEVTMLVMPSKGLQEWGTVRFSCEGAGNPNEIIWKWYRNNMIIPDAQEQTLTMTAVTRQYNGNTIACEAINKVGSTKQTYTLNVEFAPRFTAPARHVAVDFAADADLKCNVDGNPKPTIIWTRLGSSKILGSSETLHLSGVTGRDFFTYVCTATVVGFPEIAMNIHLMRNGPPKIISNEVQYARQREKGYVICDMTAVPKPDKVTWWKDGRPIDVQDSKRYQVKDDNRPDGKRAFLVIDKMVAADFGEYNCSIDNGYGHDFKLILLKPKDEAKMAIIVGGVCGAIALFLLIILGVYIYNKRRLGMDDTDSETDSEGSVKKKKTNTPEVKIEYKTGPETWDNELNKDYYRRSAEYDELNVNFPPTSTGNGFPTFDSRNGVYGPRDNAIYGGYRGMEGPYAPRSDTYGNRFDSGNYGSMPRNSNYSPSENHYVDNREFPPPPAPVAPSSRLSTNV